MHNHNVSFQVCIVDCTFWAMGTLQLWFFTTFKFYMPLQCSGITVSFHALRTFKTSAVCMTPSVQRPRENDSWLKGCYVLLNRLKLR